jgi:hypothetical protein
MRVLRTAGTTLALFIGINAMLVVTLGVVTGPVGVAFAIVSLPVAALLSVPVGAVVGVVHLSAMHVPVLRRRPVIALLMATAAVTAGYVVNSIYEASLDVGPYAGGPNDYRDTVVRLGTTIFLAAGLVTGLIVRVRPPVGNLRPGPTTRQPRSALPPVE